MSHRITKDERGLTLIEAMVALSVLLVGLLGLLRLHVVGTTSNTGGRMHTQATEMARELVAGLERLPYEDSLLSEIGSADDDPPSTFGWLLAADGTVTSTSGVHGDHAGEVVPGVRLASELPAGYQRRWTVWHYLAPGTTIPAASIVAVSVVWKEPSFGRPREIVMYTQIPNPAALMAGLAVNQ